MGEEHRILAAQGGLITRAQALSAGLGRSTITRRLDQREWHSVFPGVYRHAAAQICDRLMLEAAMLWLGPNAVLWASWAAWWHEFRSEPEGPVALTVPRSHSRRVHRHLDLRRRDLDPADVVVLRGVRVTSRSLTALENAGLPAGHNVFDRALQRHTSLTELTCSLDRLSGAYGAAAARTALTERLDGTVSPPERELARAMRRHGISGLKAGFRVEAGGRWFLLDFACPTARVAIEVDGVAPHTKPEVFHQDRARQNALVMAGWTVLRFTPWQIRNQLTVVLEQIVTALARGR